MLNSLRLKSVLSVAVSFTCLFASAQNSFSKMNTPAVPTAESSHEGHGFSYVDYSSRMDKDINPESTEAFDMTPTPRFEENKGQWDSQVTYKTELTNGNIFFGKTGYTVQFTDQTDAYERNHHADEEEAKRNTVRNHAYQVQYIGANPNPGMFASGPAEYRKSYFVGNDSRKWAAEVGMYNTMEYTNVYPGINITYKSYYDNLKYDITVAPGADPSVIRMSYKGVSKQYVDANGNLITVTTLGQTKEYAPVAYQIINGSKVIVPARYAGSNGDIYYEFPNGYDSNYELVIDPFLVASTYSGSTADNWGFTACPGLNGNMCMAGIAFAAGYPTTVGAYNTAFSGACDITISIFNSTGTTLLASTYLGGTGNDYPHSIIVGTNGDMYLTGRTESNNFPTSAGCYDNTFNGGTTDMIICRLNSTLSTLIGSTYVGGSGLDATNTVNSFTGTTQTRFSYADNGRSQIRLDNTGNVVVVSNTQSANWPTTVGCYDNALSGTQDGVVLKMNNALTALTFSTYIGGGNYDACFSVQIDATNNLYVAGLTNSNNFPTTAGVINTAALGGVDGFVFRMNATGTTLVSSTYLGTANKDGAFNVDLDNSGNVYVFGLSAGGAYPVTAGVYSNANSCQFVHGLNAGLTATLFSTKYGNTTTPNISPTAFEVDTCGNIYCAGWGRAFDGGSSNGMPTTAGAYQTTTDGADFHFMVFDPLCAGMRYATFFGQNGGTADHVDGGTSLFSNRGSDQGVIYQAVCASCGAATTGFPTTVGAYSGTDNSTNCNEAVLKFDMETYSPGAAAIAVGGGGCAGQPITFTNNSTNSTTYEWDFGDGSPVDNNINPTHTYASAGTYTVQLVAFNATTCILSDTTTTVVTIQPAPTTANAGTDATACGLTATLAGNAAVVGTGTWTQVSGPGTTTFSNANSPTSTATASVLGAYVYQWTIASAPCNPSSDQVTITFVAAPTSSNAGPDQTICSTGGSATMAGNNPAVGTGTWTQVSGPLTATITTPTNRLTTITGMTTPGVYVFQWSIANAPCPASTDQMQVTVNAPPTASNAGPDASVCGLTATLAGNVPTTGTGTWTQVAGPGTSTFSNANSATSNVTVSVVGVYTFRWTIANAPCTASQDNVIITFVAAPTVSNAGPDQTICTTGGSATMAGNAPVVGTGTWTQVSGPVTATITTPGSNATTITGMTTAGTYVFQWSIANAPCAASTDQITVTVNAPPTASNAGPDASVCGLTATLAGNVPTTGTGTWTQVAGPGTSTFSNANSATSNVTVSVVGAYTFRWTIANAPCTASQDNVIITFVAAPTVSNAGPDQTICTTGGSATMAGNAPVVGTGTWTQVSGPVTATITTPGSNATTITGMTTAGTYVFQWSIANAPCAASTDQITVTVNAPPTVSNAGPDASVCGLTATLAGNVPTTGTGTWTQVAGPGTSTFSNANSATSNVTVSVVGAYTFRWTIANAPCTASQDNVIITFVAAPTVSNAGPDQTICSTGGSATMAGNNPAVGTGTWTQVSGPVTATITTPTNRLTTITGMTTPGVYVFQWSIANAPCPASTDQMQVTVNAPPTTANAGSDQTICATSATMAGNAAAIGTGTWTQVSGPNTATITTPGSPTSTMTGLVAGTYVFQWTIANAPCTASSDQVTITVSAPPTTSNAGPDQTICTTGGSATMAGNVPAVGTGTWTQVSGPVTATITTPGSNATTITGMTTAGTYVFQWTITNVCGSSNDQITVIVNAPPTASNAGPDASVCGLTATLAGNVPTTGTGTWTLVAGPGTATFSNANSATSNVTVSVVGVYTFRWTIANAPCTASQDNVIITFVAAPTVSNAGPDQTICSTGGSATMAGNVPTVGTGTWTQVSGPVTATITTPGSNATTITGMTTAGTYVFQWSIANSPCPSSTDQVQIIVNAPPTASNAGPDASVCGLTATLAANVPSIGTGTWTQTAGPGTSTFSNANSAFTSVTVSTAGSYTFTWTIANAPCASSADAVTIVFTTAPTTANAGADQTICSTSGSATMAGNVPAVGTGTWSQVSGPVTATITTPGSNATTVTGMTTAGTYVFQWSIANVPCPASTDQVQIIVNAPPTASNAGSAASVCGLTATLAGNIPTVGTGTWTQTAGPGTSTFTNANLGSSDVTVTVAGTYTYTWTITNAPCAASASTVNITFVNAPSAALAGADDTICGLNSTLAGNIPASGTGTWTQVSGPGTTTFTNANLGNTAFSVSTQGVYVYAWTITNAPCPQTSDTVTITLDAQPSASNAGPDQLNVCPPSVTMAANAPVFGAGTWTQIAGPNTANIVTPNSEATSIGALIPGTYTFVWTITNGSCPATTDTVNVVVIGCDSDGDGINDITDLDDDNDGIPDTVEATADTDGDGIPNSLDLDSDNDGIPDVQEAGGNDTNNDGIIDGFTDLNGDGLDDNTAANPLPNPDTDGDGIVNAQDLDSDNDGITDVTEAGGTDANGDGILDGYVDTDGDGWNDVADANNGGTPLPTPDTDGDGHNDYVDLDSDNDGITDVTEAGGTDANGDGIIDGYTDTDGDGFSDNVDTNNGGTMLPNGDQDGDGIPNVLDLDSDNDGITDVTEAGGTDANGDGIIDGFADTDNDGLSDNVDPNNGGTPLPTPDTDGDGLDNYLDVDSDNDGITDVTEAGGTDANNDGIIDGYVDTDNDGLSDNVDTNNGGTMLAVGDFDNDGIENYLDLDSDNDGIVDVIEAGGVDGDNDGIIGTGPVVDTDGDGLSDVVDTDNGGTALPVPNTDASGGADYLDIDADNDGIVDNIEGQPTASYVAPTGVDTDGDGIDDAYDTIVGFGGAGVTPTNTDGADTPDYIDLDSDNDTAPDTTEGWDTNNDGVADTLPSGNDSDNDGLDDAYDADGTSTTNAGGSNNGGDLPTDFPDLDNVGGDRDWRDPLDTDGDGISNVNDLDDDNDGIPDTLEASGDTDGDGIPDSLDLDSDNDGIPDVTEAGGTDLNGDGIIDGFTDTNGDGLDDNTAANPLPNGDTDGDGLPDAIDLDSDNDGIPDVTEAGGTDLNGDGIIDGYVDTDGDGLSDNVDTNNGGTALPNPDTDGDGVNDVLDLDSDNDGITDVTEAGGVDANGDGIIDGYVDTDNDGLSDNVDTNNGGTALPTPDTDGDGINDMLDLDSDNDGITDVVEAGGTDANGDGIIDGYVDTDGDGLSDNVDPNNGGTPLPIPDTDNDGHVNYLDIDADNDGIVDNIEAQTTAGYVPPTGQDTDGDGIDNAYDTDNGGTPIVLTNTDGADNPDYLDLDSDNDGMSDLLEGWDTNNDGVADTTPSGNDSDNDGLDDAFDVDGTSTTNAGGSTNGGDLPTDFPDLDNVGGDRDWRDGIDHDNDGIDDIVDLDDDNDGIPDTFEASGDTDGDGIPDSLDLDSDNDGIADIIEAGGTDANGDGLVDNFVDTNNDGLDDNIAANPIGNPDSDGDGIPNTTDLDSDNDGILDVIEAGGTDANGDGLLDNYVDTDGDGWNDNADPNAGGTLLPTPDTDSDGNMNFLDIDADNDGIVDNVEGQSTGGYTPPTGTDTDGDGIDDAYDIDNGGTPINPVNTDGTDNPDYLDLDSDNDGDSDAIEAWDTNNDGDPEITPTGNDSDGDGLDDAYDIDGTSTTNNGGATNGGTTPNSFPDLDNPGGDRDWREIIGTELEIPTGFSPNGDGVNDFFEIVGIGNYPDNKVTIFNRWGNLVYEAAGYDNGAVRWNGENTGNLSVGNGPVPEGTYFYVIDLGDGSEVISGYVFLNRQ